MVGLEKRVITKGQVDDLVLLDDISEDGVVKNLKARFDNDLIYSYIGPVLVSVNPFKQINGLYTKELMQRYYGKHKFEQAPHVFASAEEAYRHLLSTAKNQCILVSGESGAGKTEAAKKIMEYVTQVSDDRAEANKGLSTRDIKDALLQSNPVLEAFGNATTLRNDNSSRFGKYMIIQMDYNGVPVGGSITNYLLEKPRVVGQTQGERSFHVFYQLCAGTKGSMRSDLMLDSASNFNYIKTTTDVKSIDDKAQFEVMNSALEKVGVNSEDRMNLYKAVAAVLHLGNISFTEIPKKDKCEVSSSSSAALNNAAQLLGVSSSDLAWALVNRTIENKMDRIASPLVQPEECEKTRDALAKSLYSRAFQKLVSLINVKIAHQMDELCLGVLDIYGFEIFKYNSFEQLCINYANEKLQQLFIQLTLKGEQDEYAREGIQWKHIDYFNNQVVCDLIEGTKPAGIFAYMDEECIFPKGTDSSYLRKLEGNLTGHQHFKSLKSNVNNEPTEFIVKHYAGDVTYSVKNILDKNKDTLFRDLIVLMGQKSKSSFLTGLFPEAKELNDNRRPITAGTAFVRDMGQLIEDLMKCEPHYIRTIKSNNDKAANKFDVELVKGQVRYLGLVENVRVRRAGYAFRQDYSYFVQRYKMLSTSTWPHQSGKDKSDAETILKGLGISDLSWGKTKVFIREPTSVFKLEEARDKRIEELVTLIQKAYRGYKAKLYYLKLREESVHLLHGKKRRRQSWVLYFLGDYIFAQDNKEITGQIDGRVKFADEVKTLVNGKMIKKWLVITSSTLYMFNKKMMQVPDESGKKVMMTKWVVDNTVSFKDIKSFGLTKFADGWMVIDAVNPTPKPMPTLVIDSMRKAEIVTLLNDLFKTQLRKEFPMIFQNEFPVVVSKRGPLDCLFGIKYSPSTLKFVEADTPMLHSRADTYLTAQNIKENPEFKTCVLVQVSPLLVSKAAIQLDTPVPERLAEYKGKPGQKKRIPYAGYRVIDAATAAKERKAAEAREKELKAAREAKRAAARGMAGPVKGKK